MSENPIKRWHQLLAARDTNGIARILADEATFHSPIVHTPQIGKKLTTMYLQAAFHVLANDSFRYVREAMEGNLAVLEFHTVIDGIEINGVDMIAWNDAGLITDFKVMLRPLKAITLMQEKMAAMLAAVGTQAGETKTA